MKGWTTRVTGFGLVTYAGKILMIRHDRLGVVRWEMPGGHVEADESVESAAAREVAEETGVEIEIGDHLGTYVHEWAERRQRRLVLCFAATPVDPGAALAPSPENRILEVAWHDPRELAAEEMSPFLHPLVADWPALPRGPLHVTADHVLGTDGHWHPRILSTAREARSSQRPIPSAHSAQRAR